MRNNRTLFILLTLSLVLLCLANVTVCYFHNKSFLEPSETKALTDKIESISQSKGYKAKTTSYMRECRRGLVDADEYNYCVEITNDEFNGDHKYAFNIITSDSLSFSILDHSNISFCLFGDANTDVDFSLFEEVANTVFSDEISSDDLKAFYEDFIEEIDKENGDIDYYEKKQGNFTITNYDNKEIDYCLQVSGKLK